MQQRDEVYSKSSKSHRYRSRREDNPMIHDFLFILNNGIKTKVGEYLPSVPILDQINDPAYRPKAYEWESEGETYTRLIDGNETVTARPLSDGTGVVVLQSEDTYGSNNVIILNPANEMLRRITNPYRTSKFFMNGDRFWFDAIKVSGKEVFLNIQVHRKLAGRSHDAVPIYEANYDPMTWNLKKIEWKPAT